MASLACLILARLLNLCHLKADRATAVPLVLPPFRLAAYTGREALLRALLDLGANPNLPDAQGVSPLWAACAARRGPCVSALLAARAAGLK